MKFGVNYLAISSYIWNNPRLKPKKLLENLIKMKIQGNEIKPGMIIELNNDHWTVLKTQHVKPGKGGAFNQVELKSLTKGTKLNQRFRSSENVERAQLEEKEFNFLYSDESGCFFMDPENFEQISIKKELLGEKLKLLTENLKSYNIFS